MYRCLTIKQHPVYEDGSKTLIGSYPLLEKELDKQHKEGYQLVSCIPAGNSFFVILKNDR